MLLLLLIQVLQVPFSWQNLGVLLLVWQQQVCRVVVQVSLQVPPLEQHLRWSLQVPSPLTWH